MAINSTLPEYLAQRTHWTSESVSRGLQLGAQMYQQSQQEKRMQRASALQEEAKRYALEEKERIAEGTVAVTRVLSEMGKTGGYSDPALQAKFWDEVHNHPRFAGSQAFKDIMDTFQYAEQAKARKELLGTTYELRGDAAEQRHLLRLDEIDAQLEKALTTENLSQENRERLEGIRHSNRQEIIRLRPTGSRPAQLDLDKSDQMLMQSELKNLESWREIHPGPKNDAEYGQRLNAIEQKFNARKKVSTQPIPPAVAPPASVAPTTDKRVRVVSPSGKVGNIPESQLEDALKQGYKPAP